MLRLIIFAVVVASAACSGVDVPVVPVGETVSYAAHLEPLVVARCLSCHTADEPEAQLVLEVGSGYDAMVGQSSTQEPDELMVVPGDVEASYLWRKLVHDVEIGRGMPRTIVGSIELPAEELELFRRWIAEGAHP